MHDPVVAPPPDIDVSGVETPAYVVDLGRLRANLSILADVQSRTGCKILLALKGFAMWSVFPVVGEYLAGIAASSPHEARLGREQLGKEVHAYAPAYSEADIAELVTLVDHIVFNSFAQWQRFRSAVGGIACGVRINPQHSEVPVPLYDPCAAGSRLGVTRAEFRPDQMDGLSGLHFHTLCELGSDALERTLAVVEEKFDAELRRVQWVNFGGGHHITRPDYDVERLVRIVKDFRARRGLEVYLEPGEAIAINTGILVSSVLDLTSTTAGIASPSSTPPPPPTCRTSSRCPTARSSSVPAGRASTRTPIGSAVSPAWRATSSGTTPSRVRSRSATSWSSPTWPTTRWSRTPPSTGSGCRPSPSTTRPPGPSRSFAASAIPTTRIASPESPGPNGPPANRLRWI